MYVLLIILRMLPLISSARARTRLGMCYMGCRLQIYKKWLEHWSFVGDHWNRIKKQERQTFLKNAYRVLLTRARQGMVIVVPQGSSEDLTRKDGFYDPTFKYLQEIGFKVI